MPHTSLPWKAHDDRVRAYISQANGIRMVCTMNNFSVTQSHEAIDNARLIVTAVNSHADLLAACKDALDLLRSIRDAHGDLWDQIVDPSAAIVWDELKAAIAKAEGKATK